jgi:hypothetical protein
MSIDTQLLIIYLLDREIGRADHIATLGYRDDVKTAKQDFINYAKTLRTDKRRR